ncbi:BON domain-containing protein [Wenzhouxiangella sp. C33]|uniref:BON domain-containing protein n=2 Tax=Wenzhouxiangella limi TaxID=2707351 RepID=A0A845UWN3_9GAMM|nr:BON domain-containing protein [Wenzhouxiangella limi]
MLVVPLSLAASDMSDEAAEARIEGRLLMAYALNAHLSTFDFDVDVDRSRAILMGQVEESVQKDLAGEIALDVDGIDEVDNRIQVAGEASEGETAGRSFRQRFEDATTTASVKSKLLWNQNTGGLDIEVSTRDSAVILEGEADSEASKELAERLAGNTDGVRSVDNRIRVTGNASDPSRDAGDVVSDSWITTKVRSTFIFSNVPARSIGIDTTDGVVTLDGEVDNDAAHELAVELASDIRGVREVNADQLRIADDS